MRISPIRKYCKESGRKKNNSLFTQMQIFYLEKQLITCGRKKKI